MLSGCAPSMADTKTRMLSSETLESMAPSPNLAVYLARCIPG
jgi:hypothetical protein